MLRVWQEADALPELEHAWLFDHLMPIGGDPRRSDLRRVDAALRTRRPDATAPNGTTGDQQPLSTTGAASQDRHDRRRRLRRASRLRHRCRIATQPPPLARREYEANGLPYDDFADSVASLAEALVVIKKSWTETQPFDVAGDHVTVTGAFGNPKPVQRPHPPL